MWIYRFFKISILILFIAQFAQFAYASGIKISWDKNSESDVAGYKVYYGTASHNYQSSLDAGNFTSIEIDDLTPGKNYYISIAAYDYSGNESASSQEVHATIPEDSGSGSGTGSSGGSSCFISTSGSERSVSQRATFLLLTGMVLMVIRSHIPATEVPRY
jgi:hypothetical protein